MNSIDIDSLKNEDLCELFNLIMDSYAKRLCESFEFDINDCFWVGNDRNDCFALGDCGIFITSENVKKIVENNIDYNTYIEWDDYNKCINYAKINHPESINKYNYINLLSWIKGYPKELTKEEMDNEERTYWNNMVKIKE